MLADLIRGFCNENNYEAYEGYSGRYMFGKMTIGIIVRQDQNYFEMFAELTRYLESKGFGDPLMEREGTAIDELGLSVVVYFPAIQNYQPEE